MVKHRQKSHDIPIPQINLENNKIGNVLNESLLTPETPPDIDSIDRGKQKPISFINKSK
jgi:hypothetical protein